MSICMVVDIRYFCIFLSGRGDFVVASIIKYWCGCVYVLVFYRWQNFRPVVTYSSKVFVVQNICSDKAACQMHEDFPRP